MLVNTDLKNIKEIQFYLEKSEKGFVVAEINEIPIVFEFINQLNSKITLIDVGKTDSYISEMRNSKTKNIVLYNFDDKYSNYKAIADDINFSRDLFFSLNKNIIFVLSTYVVTELIRSNVSFWSCVSLHKIFQSNKPICYTSQYLYCFNSRFNPSSDKEDDIHFNLEYSFCKNLKCTHNCKLFSPSDCYNKTVNITNNSDWVHACLQLAKTLCNHQQFPLAKECCNKIIQVSINNTFRLQAFELLASIFYYQNEFEKSLFYNNLIITKDRNEEYISAVALNNSAVVFSKINDDKESFSLITDLYIESVQLLKATEFKYIDEYCTVLLNYSVSQFKECKFEDAINTLKIIQQINNPRAFEYILKSKLIEAFILTKLGDRKGSKIIIDSIEHNIISLKTEDAILISMFYYNISFLEFASGKYISAIKTLRKNKQYFLNSRSNKTNNTYLKYMYHYLYGMCLYCHDNSKIKKSYEHFRLALQYSVSNDDKHNINAILDWLNNTQQQS